MIDDKDRLKNLVCGLVRKGYISKPELIDAMEVVDRRHFVPPHLSSHAYGDYPLEIGAGQTISAPHMVGIMVEKLELAKGQKVLEIGTGSGYHAAIVAKIIQPGIVYTVERHSALAVQAKRTLSALNIHNIEIAVADGSKGLEAHAPYDRIFVTCAAPRLPEPLIDQLRDGGKLMVPVGTRSSQYLIVAEKCGKKLKTKNYGGCVFVPLVGEHGF